MVAAGAASSAGEQQALIDSSPLALVEFGLDTRIRLWNPAAERIFGWTAGRCSAAAASRWRRPPGARESEDLFERVRAGESINDYETLRLRKDGTLVPVSIAAAPVRDGSAGWSATWSPTPTSPSARRRRSGCRR